MNIYVYPEEFGDSTVHEWDESTVEYVFLQFSKYLCHVCLLGQLMLGLSNPQWLVYFLLAIQLESQQSSLTTPFYSSVITFFKVLLWDDAMCNYQTPSGVQQMESEYN